MTVLRVDPWDPEYGASVDDADDPDRPPPEVEFDEPGPWAPVSCPEPDSIGRFAFIDGVRRVDVRLFAEEDDVIAPALAASLAVGVAWSGPDATIDDVRVRRVLILGRGLDHGAVDVSVGEHKLSYVPLISDAKNPLEALQQLQNAMRDEESALATAVADRGEAEILLQDGPLSYSGRAPTVGVIKRQTQRYLDPERQRILATLQPGQRTPLFRFESAKLPRFSWYVRIAVKRDIDGTLAGLVRLEVHANQGLAEAQRLANITSGILPRFAAPLGRDSRAPQNLYPVGQLELVLRNRLGNPDLLRRAVERALFESLTGASA